MNPASTDHLDTALSPRRRAELLLDVLSTDEKMAQIRCIFPRDARSLDGLLDGLSASVGHVSALEMRQGTDLDQVASFQRDLQRQIIAASPHQIPAIFHMEALGGAYLPGATSFPTGISRGATWDPDLEEELGAVIGAQQRAVGITYALAPVLDISRDPRMGRQGETYGEDPTLAARLGVALTRGLQRADHDVRSTEAVAKHFMGFHAGEGGIHGTHADVPERLLLEVYGAPFQAAITQASLRGIMPCYNSIGGEVASASHRLLTQILRGDMGFDGVTASDYGAVGNLHLHQRVAESFADAGEIALQAGMDVEWHMVSGFNDELGDRFADGLADPATLDRAVLRVLEAKFRMGLFEHPLADEGSTLHAPFEDPRGPAITLRAARESLVLLRNDGTLPLHPDRAAIAVIGPQAGNARFLFGGYSHVSMAEGLLATKSSMAGLSGDDGHRAVEDVIAGTRVQCSDDPMFNDVLDAISPYTPSLVDELRRRLPNAEITYARGHQIAGSDDSGYAEALAATSGCDVAIMMLGGKYGTSSIATTGEGVDSTHIGIPRSQEMLLERLAATGIPIIGVHLDGRPISSDVADRCCAALLEAWSPSEAGAEAIVDVITGAVNPSGRLPVSIARNSGQIPVYYNHPYGSQWHQGDSVGFSEYLDLPHTPRYPFGFGLSYTTFIYEDLQISAEHATVEDTVEISCTVRNSGDREGTEVVQLYVSDRFASMSRPVKQLAGFSRVEIPAGESRQIVFALDISSLAFLDTKMRWAVEAGDFDLRIGSSSEDIHLETTLHVSADAAVDSRNRGFWAEPTIALVTR